MEDYDLALNTSDLKNSRPLKSGELPNTDDMPLITHNPGDSAH